MPAASAQQILPHGVLNSTPLRSPLAGTSSTYSSSCWTLLATTQDGLSQQLLGVVVAHERPDLESSRQDLIREMSSNKGLLSKLEDTLLRELSSATGVMAKRGFGGL